MLLLFWKNDPLGVSKRTSLTFSRTTARYEVTTSESPTVAGVGPPSRVGTRVSFARSSVVRPNAGAVSESRRRRVAPLGKELMELGERAREEGDSSQLSPPQLRVVLRPPHTLTS